MHLSLTEMVYASLKTTQKDPLYTHQQLPHFGLRSFPLPSPSPGASPVRHRYKASKCPQSPEPEKPIQRRKRGNTAGALLSGQEKAGNSPIPTFFICTSNSLDLHSLKETLRLEPRCEDCRSALCHCAKTVKDTDLRKLQGRIRRRKENNPLWDRLPKPAPPASRTHTAVASLRLSRRSPQALLRPPQCPASPSPLQTALSVCKAGLNQRRG